MPIMSITPFHERLSAPLRASHIDCLQVNVGKHCNQTCKHCHVDAGPRRQEMMSLETARWVVTALERHPELQTLDITGGAPELCPPFRYLVEEGARLGRRVIDRCNLTVFYQPGQADLPAFLAKHHVEIIASLPCYLEENVDEQRGTGTYRRSIEALQWLNRLGYGQDDPALQLNLVYNPIGAYLPPSQQALEADYRRELRERHGIRFNRLYTLTNMPISRFLAFLKTSGQYESYMQKLEAGFNPATVPHVMCRSLVSVGWDGTLYDCDFNQMLESPVGSGPSHIKDFDAALLSKRRIVTGDHCYGCTAGAGSSCGGEVVRVQN